MWIQLNGTAYNDDFWTLTPKFYIELQVGWKHNEDWLFAISLGTINLIVALIHHKSLWDHYEMRNEIRSKISKQI